MQRCTQSSQWRGQTTDQPVTHPAALSHPQPPTVRPRKQGTHGTQEPMMTQMVRESALWPHARPPVGCRRRQGGGVSFSPNKSQTHQPPHHTRVCAPPSAPCDCNGPPSSRSPDSLQQHTCFILILRLVLQAELGHQGANNAALARTTSDLASHFPCCCFFRPRLPTLPILL
jgi:hypothetical protein